MRSEPAPQPVPPAHTVHALHAARPRGDTFFSFFFSSSGRGGAVTHYTAADPAVFMPRINQTLRLHPALKPQPGLAGPGRLRL